MFIFLAAFLAFAMTACTGNNPEKESAAVVGSDSDTDSMDTIIAMCMAETSKDPIAILEKMMSQPFCHMHGPEHHVLVGAALLTAYNNAAADCRCREVPVAIWVPAVPLSAPASSCRLSPATLRSPPRHGSCAT